MVSPRTSLIISDEGLSTGTGRGTEFVILMSGEPQGGIKHRRHVPQFEIGYDRPSGWSPYSHSNFGRPLSLGKLKKLRDGSVSKAAEQTYRCGPPTFCLGVDSEENVVVRKRLRRGQVIAFFEALTPCLVGMEACATSHYWAGSLTKLGHEVRLMPARDVNA